MPSATEICAVSGRAASPTQPRSVSLSQPPKSAPAPEPRRRQLKSRPT
jgi:hypothetical protein